MFVYGASFTDVHRVVRDMSDARLRRKHHRTHREDRTNGADIHTPCARHDRVGCQGKRVHVRQGHRPEGRRRTISACWHAHYNVLAELFARFPAARVVTKIATCTAPTFSDRALETSYLNVGSNLFPATASDCCECDHTDHVDDFDSAPTSDAMRPNTDVDYFLHELDRVLAEH
jgi:hypothetical protein